MKKLIKTNKRLIFFTWLVVTSTVNLQAYADGISGTYLGRNSNSAFLFQVVQTDGKHLTGRFEEVELLSDGKISDSNFEFVGVTDGGTIAGTIKLNELLSSALTVSGSIDGKKLNLSGGTNLKLNLIKGDESEFVAQVGLLNKRSQQILLEKENVKQNAELQKLAQSLKNFTSRADENLNQFATIEPKYKSATTNMSQMLDRENSIIGDGQKSVARGQISVAIHQVNVNATQLHLNIQNSSEEFQTKSKQLLIGIGHATKACREQHTVLQSTWNSNCSLFSDAASQFQQRVGKLQSVYEGMELVWQEENRKQELIMRNSDVAVR